MNIEIDNPTVAVAVPTRVEVTREFAGGFATVAMSARPIGASGRYLVDVEVTRHDGAGDDLASLLGCGEADVAARVDEMLADASLARYERRQERR